MTLMINSNNPFPLLFPSLKDLRGVLKNLQQNITIGIGMMLEKKNIRFNVV